MFHSRTAIKEFFSSLSCFSPLPLPLPSSSSPSFSFSSSSFFFSSPSFSCSSSSFLHFLHPHKCQSNLWHLHAKEPPLPPPYPSTCHPCHHVPAAGRWHVPSNSSRPFAGVLKPPISSAPGSVLAAAWKESCHPHSSCFSLLFPSFFPVRVRSPFLRPVEQN